MIAIGTGNAYVEVAQWLINFKQNPTNALSTYGPAVSFQQNITGYTLPTFAQQIYKLSAGLPTTTTYGIGNCAISGTGQYILVPTDKGYFSSNFGNNFSILTMISGNTSNPVINYSGQYMFIQANVLWRSTSYGQYWTNTGLSLGTTPLAISQNGKYILAAYYLSNDYGQTFTATPGLPTTGNYYGSCISSDGQYMFAPIQQAGAYLTSNYGNNWNLISTDASTGIPTLFTWRGSAMSASGQYIITGNFGANDALGGSFLYVSSTYGKTWYKSSGSPYNNSQINFMRMSMDQTGQYMYASVHFNNYMFYSTTYGANWVQNAFSTSMVTINNSGGGNPFAIVSGNGLYSLIYGNQSSPIQVWLSTTYASSYTATTTSTLTSPTVSTPTYQTSYGTTWVTNPGTGLSTFYALAAVSMSGSGQYILAGDSIYGGPSYAGMGIYLSNNFGSSWTLLGTTNGLAASANAVYNCLAVSNSGQYMIFAAASYIYVSSNFGVYFNSKANVGLPGSLSGQLTIFVVSVSGDGKYMLYNNNTAGGAFYLSTDFGNNWNNTGYNGFGSAISGDGKYMYFSTSGTTIRVSSNYGVSFTQVTNPTSTGSNAYGYCISNSGQYMYARGNLSTNFGVSFQTNSATVAEANCMSYTGQFLLAGNSFSSNYGVSFTTLSGLTQLRHISISNYAEYIVGINNSLQLSTSVSSSISTTAVVQNPYWYSVTTDSTGQYVAVGSIMNQGIWYSTDFANTWQSSNQNVGTVQQLANSGTYMLAAINNVSGVYYSSNYGAWWQGASTPNSANYISVAMASSATYAIAASNGSGVVYSSTYGQTWQSSNFTTGTYSAVAISSTGQYGLASNSTAIYYSTNFGQTFIVSGQTSVNTQSLAISSTGQYAVAGTTTGIYYSTSYGQTWSQSNQTAGTWYGINIMSTGQYLVAGNAGQGLWYSLNFGQTWTQSTSNTTDTWYQISTTPSGSYLYAVSQAQPFTKKPTLLRQ